MNQSDQFTITISQRGRFVAEAKISFVDESGIRHARAINSIPYESLQNILIPFGSTNIQIVISIFTGLVWKPKEVIKEIKLTEARSIRILISGTTLNPHCHTE